MINFWIIISPWLKFDTLQFLKIINCVNNLHYDKISLSEKKKMLAAFFLSYKFIWR